MTAGGRAWPRVCLVDKCDGHCDNIYIDRSRSRQKATRSVSLAPFIASCIRMRIKVFLNIYFRIRICHCAIMPVFAKILLLLLPLLLYPAVRFIRRVINFAIAYRYYALCILRQLYSRPFRPYLAEDQLVKLHLFPWTYELFATLA